MQQRRVRRARCGGIEVRGKRLDVELDQVERGARRGRIVRCDGGDRLATIADPLARQRKLVLRDRDDAISHRAVVAGDHGTHAGKGARSFDVDRMKGAVRDRAPQYRADQRVRRRQVGRVLRAARDFLDAVDQRLADADRGRGTEVPACRGFRSPIRVVHPGSPTLALEAAASTASMIFT